MIRRRALIAGRVQGVFFRDSLRRRAEAAGVGGWARNREDGRVEVVVEGEARAVEAVLEWCREGPPGAVVEAVSVSAEEPEGLAGFEVR